jgi:nucleoside 2-deoxyribosyltransferase
MTKIDIIKKSYNSIQLKSINCPICGIEYCRSSESPLRRIHETIIYTYKCLRCGIFSIPINIDNILKEELKDKNNNGIIVSSYLREEYEKLNSDTYEFKDVDDIKVLIRNALTNIPSISEKLFKLLKAIECMQGIPGKEIQIISELDSIRIYFNHELPFYHYFLAMSYSSNDKELGFYLNSLKELGYIKRHGEFPSTIPSNISITVKGFEYLEQQRTLDRSQSKDAFIAIKFDESYQSVSDFIANSIKENGYNAVRVDGQHHTEFIMDYNMRKIKECRFMVAELSSKNLGVYYEAGYAMGIGVPVIAVAKKDRKKDIHFDLKQLNTIFYDSNEKLQEILSNRIAVLFGDLKSNTLAYNL